jgi:hypothetical protein
MRFRNDKKYEFCGVLGASCSVFSI